MSDPAVLATPMHGFHKLLTEGYRTRDGHLIEWFGRLAGPAGEVAIHSRPEPFPRRELAHLRYRHRAAPNTVDVGRSLLRLPSHRDRRAWWTSTLQHYRVPVSGTAPVVVWNPLVAVSNAAESLLTPERAVLFDLLDDWLVHPAFRRMRDLLTDAYRRLFERAEYVTTNSEGTLALAQSFGRDDARLVPNGCDPDRFSPVSRADGPTTVGYVGKIGSRLDFKLIDAVVRALPHVRFVFAGPTLDRGLAVQTTRRPNVDVLGDVPYGRVPDLLTSFDIGWVPHAVGDGEVGGDAIKIYEYRAAGLPVLTTPIIGTRERWSTGVSVVDPGEHAGHLAHMAQSGPRVPRVVTPISPDFTWRSKARGMLELLDVRVAGDE